MGRRSDRLQTAGNRSEAVKKLKTPEILAPKRLITKKCFLRFGDFSIFSQLLSDGGAQRLRCRMLRYLGLCSVNAALRTPRLTGCDRMRGIQKGLGFLLAPG